MALDTPPEARAKLGPYELLKEQAHSGTGATWLASSFVDPDAPPVALLRVHKHVLKKADAAEAFLAESAKAIPFRHPNALGVLDTGTHEGEAYVVTEHVDGESLAALAAAAGAGGLPLPIVLRITLDVLAGLDAAHGETEPLLHGELGPQHVRVGLDGVARIAGFGTARALAKLPSVGAKNQDRLAYAAPERVKSMASPIAPQVPLEPRADVFSVGVMLWEGASHQRLFTSKIEAAVIQKVLTAPIAALGSIAGLAVPAAVDEATQKALDRDPARRFQSAKEMAAALEAAGDEHVASHAAVAEAVAKIAGKGANKSTTLAPPAPRAAGAEAKAVVIPKLAPVKSIEPVKPAETKPAAAKPVETKPMEPVKPVEAVKPALPAAKPGAPPRKQTLLGIAALVPPKVDVTPPPGKPDAPPPREIIESITDEVSFDVDDSIPPQPAVAPKPPPVPPAAKPAAPPPNKRGVTLMMGTPALSEPEPPPASNKAAEKPVEAKAQTPAAPPASARPQAASAASLLKSVETGTGKTGGDTPTSDSIRRGKSGTAIDKIGPGSTLGRYEILMQVARGGMASVWAARLVGTRGFQKIVAVKTMLPDVSDDPDFETMFLDEARVAARIRHPNVAEILDLGEQDDVLYLVMEWVEGENLGVTIKSARALGGVPLPIALRIASQASAGLHAAHELRDDSGNLVDLIHRDVSPANVLISTAGFVKLVDFGVAKSKGRMHVTRAGGMVKGKTPYLSPEQLGALPIDRRSDIFSFGALLYVLATGLHPFRGETEAKTVENIALKAPVPLRTINPAIPAEFEKVVFKALEKDPNNRYSTALELQRALDAVAVSIGQPATEADVAEFVRTAIGESQAKRAAELRAAIAALDSLSGSSSELSKPDFGRLLDGVKRAATPSKAEIEPVSAKPAATEPAAGGEDVSFDDLPEPPAADAPAEPAAGSEAAGDAVAAAPPPPEPRAPFSSETKPVAKLDLIIPPPVRAEETTPPSAALDEEASAAADELAVAQPRPKKLQLIVGAAVGACALIGVLALTFGGKSKPATGTEQTTTTATTTTTTAAATTTATPTTTAPATAIPATADPTPPPAATPTPTADPTPPPVATADPTPPAPTADPTPPHVVPKGTKPPSATPPIAKPPVAKPPVAKPPVKTNPKKYDPKGI